MCVLVRVCYSEIVCVERYCGCEREGVRAGLDVSVGWGGSRVREVGGGRGMQTCLTLHSSVKTVTLHGNFHTDNGSSQGPNLEFTSQSRPD